MGILSGLFGNKAYEGLFKIEIDGKDNHAVIFVRTPDSLNKCKLYTWGIIEPTI